VTIKKKKFLSSKINLFSRVVKYIFFKDLLQRKYVCTARSRTSYKTVPLTNLNKYLYHDKSEITVKINIAKSTEEFLLKKKTLLLSLVSYLEIRLHSCNYFT